MSFLSTSGAAVVMIADEFRTRLRESLESHGFQVLEAPECDTPSLRQRLGPGNLLPDGALGGSSLVDEKPVAVMIVSAPLNGEANGDGAGIEPKGRRSKQFRWGPLVIDFDDRRVFVAGRQVLLTQTEHTLLCILAEQAGKLVLNRHIIRKLWGDATGAKLRCLRVHACSLRRKLSHPLISKLILTDFGLGYRLANPEAVQ